MPQRNDRDYEIPVVPGSAELAYSSIPLPEVDNAILQQGLVYWRALAGDRSFPTRGDITPRGLVGLLRNTKLLRVIDGGKDYEFRIAGDAFVLAHGVSFQGKYQSEVAALLPSYAAAVKVVYDRVVATAEPLAMRGWIARGVRKAEHIYAEGVYLPLGPDEKTVDHILAFAVYVPRDRLEKTP
jgi:hypothetical protein